MRHDSDDHYVRFEGCYLGHPWVEQYRIPLVTSPYVRHPFEVALVVPPVSGQNAESRIWKATWPTDEEAKIVGSLIDFRRSWYRKSWADKMLARQLDVDSGTVPYILVRREDSWAYRIDTWEYGPTFVHSPRPGADPAGLVAMLDHHWTGLRWDEWKKAHPDVFGQFAATKM